MLAKLSVCKPAGAAFLKDCALAVVVLANVMESDVWVEDASIASIYMQLQAEDLGLGSCWCQIRNRQMEDDTDAAQYVRGLLDVPYQLDVLSIIGIGYKDQERKPFDESHLQWERYISELSVCQLKTNRGKYENHFLGSGNLATRLSLEMHRKGMQIGQVYSHTPENAQQLAALLGCPWTTDPETVDTDADLYVFSLKDTVLADVIARVRPNEGLWVHTAGSMPMDVFNGHTANYGVLYPMQTFSKTREVDFNVIPFFLKLIRLKMLANCNIWRRNFREISISCRPTNVKVYTWQLFLPVILPTIFMRWLLNY